MRIKNDRSNISTDVELEQRIAAALKDHHVGSLRKVKVEARGGTVVLCGEVNSFYAKQLSQHSARRLVGNNNVVNEVSVATPAAFRDPASLRETAAAGVALLFVMLLAGCSRQPTLVEVHPVSGQATVDGRPAAGAQVTFHPKDKSIAFPSPSAKVDSQGNFSLTTYSAKDGAPIGEYLITVELRPIVTKDGELELGPNVLPPQYASPKTTKAEARVAEGPNNVPINIVR